MKCKVCGCSLANSKVGETNHMKRYHSVVEEVKVEYKPMDPVEKAEKIKRLEARLSGKVLLSDTGDLKGYGTDARVHSGFEELPTTDFKLKKLSYATNAPKNQEEVVSNTKEIKSWKEFYTRLDALVENTDEALKKLKETLGE